MAGHATDGTVATGLDATTLAVDGPTVRLGAKALLTRRDRVLLVRERRTDDTTFWTLPGGGLRPGESFAEGLRRELAEELRCGADVTDPVTSCLYRHTSRPGTATVYAVFDGTLVGEPDPNRAEAVIDHRWVRPGSAPRTTLQPFQRLVDWLDDGR